MEQTVHCAANGDAPELMVGWQFGKLGVHIRPGRFRSLFQDYFDIVLGQLSAVKGENDKGRDQEIQEGENDKEEAHSLHARGQGAEDFVLRRPELVFT